MDEEKKHQKEQNSIDLKTMIQEVGVEQFSRSGGPGGQNVNKVNTQVMLRVPIEGLSLSGADTKRIKEKLANRLNADGELVIHCSETRSQAANRELAVERAAELIQSALKRQPRRIPTKPSLRAKERRLQSKKIRGQRKERRKPPHPPKDEY